MTASLVYLNDALLLLATSQTRKGKEGRKRNNHINSNIAHILD